jgi:hypothetical protein
MREREERPQSLIDPPLSQQPKGNLQVPKLVVTRKKQFHGALVPLTVEIDGSPYGKLRPGKSLEVDVSPGQHRVVSGNDGVLLFNATDQTTHVEVWISSLNNAGKIRLK